jgi:V/A-type H+-transporting ATPase subunit I
MVEKRKISSRQVLKDLYDQLSGLFISFELARVLGDMVSLSWFVDQVGSLELVSSKFVHITGWTSDRKGAVLVGALDRTRAPALIDFPPPPEGARPPQLFDNPWWARPFEFFARLMGTPGSDEIDPSPLLAVVVPVLFGYMFGDVGQGLVLCCAGLLLKRYSFSRLLIAGGISAMVFGFLFGSLFSREDVLPAFWLHPLDQPLTVLGLPLLLGITLLVLGQLLNAWGAAWRGDFKRWLAMDGGFLLAYLGLIGSFTQPVLVWAAIAGLGWYVGARFQAQRTSLTLLAGLGGFLEEFLRILANTVSFARVGAFALAHAGLSLAISILADSSGTMIAWLLIMILGNLLVILLEGLVVSVQTTRLVLLEFFSRFIRASGRTFIPMSPPPTILSGESR